MPFNFYLPLIYVVDFSLQFMCSYHMRGLVMHTCIHSIDTYDDGTISNCNIYCHTATMLTQMRRKEMKNNVAVVDHIVKQKCVLIGINNRRNVLHIHKTIRRYRKSGEHNDWHVHLVISFLEHCLLTNKQTNARIIIIITIRLICLPKRIF